MSETPADSSSRSETAANPNAPLPPLPELHGGMLNNETLAQLFEDYSHCTTVTEIIPKHAAQSHVPEQSHLTLASAQELLRTGSVRALQVRYHFDGGEWWDTIMTLPEGFRLVRIRHDFGQA
ncbi:hypothetical protein DES53_103181 [Roseimicrobium gellanilyticum]|uniref:Uncharacterized protein n=1 Tax=Roseimicrobium gellanilyticum TaxID=748857 RepID=A0A366HPZ4_9BACT|nr:hypothetical protein [Roseimicrobium gellanilyticum]RBP45184.1 hypothetical protein DES53_103181 [Roseimicrobium gellanilyticum]